MFRNILSIVAMAMIFIAGTMGTMGSAGATGIFTDNDEEIRRTWDGGYIFYPKNGRYAWGRIDEVMGDARATLAGRRYPTIVYLHGCSGIDIISTQTARDFLLKGGYVVVMPNSFARINKPTSCLPKMAKGGLHRSVIFWRQDEARNAISEARQLPFVDRRNVFLVGFSEGALTTTTLTGNEPVNARIAEGWTCHAGWQEYYGLHAPASEPILTFTSEKDPWFQRVFLSGDCGRFMKHDNGSRSVVWRDPHAAHDLHYKLWHPEVMSMALRFLRAHRR